MKRLLSLGLVCVLGTEVAAQSLTFTGAPLGGSCPRTVNLNWAASGVSSCLRLDSWSGAAPLTGSQTVTVSAASSFTLACTGQLGSADLSWAAPTFNTDGTLLTDLVGYDLFQATTAPGVPGALPSPLGLVTSTLLTGLPDGPVYVGLKARNAAGVRSAMSSLAFKSVVVPNVAQTVTATCDAAPIDTVFPVVTITGPTLGPTYATSATPLTVSGSASDNVGVTEVMWTNDRGGLGTAAGTNSWSATVPLSVGANIVTIMASDAAGNASIDTVTVNYTAPVALPKTVGMDVYDIGPQGSIGRVVGRVSLGVTCGVLYRVQDGKAYHVLPGHVVTLRNKPKPRGTILLGVCA